jgi:hypothetical protein
MSFNPRFSGNFPWYLFLTVAVKHKRFAADWAQPASGSPQAFAKVLIDVDRDGVSHLDRLRCHDDTSKIIDNRSR